MSRQTAKQHHGLTLLQLVLWIAGLAIAIVIVTVTISSSDAEHKAIKRQAAAWCVNRPAGSADSVAVDKAVVPARVERLLSSTFSTIFTRQVHYRVRASGEQLVCEVRYCYVGRRNSRSEKECTEWYVAN